MYNGPSAFKRYTQTPREGSGNSPSLKNEKYSRLKYTQRLKIKIHNIVGTLSQQPDKNYKVFTFNYYRKPVHLRYNVSESGLKLTNMKNRVNNTTNMFLKNRVFLNNKETFRNKYSNVNLENIKILPYTSR